MWVEHSKTTTSLPGFPQADSKRAGYSLPLRQSVSCLADGRTRVSTAESLSPETREDMLFVCVCLFTVILVHRQCIHPGRHTVQYSRYTVVYRVTRARGPSRIAGKELLYIQGAPQRRDTRILRCEREGSRVSLSTQRHPPRRWRRCSASGRWSASPRNSASCGYRTRGTRSCAYR